MLRRNLLMIVFTIAAVAMGLAGGWTLSPLVFDDIYSARTEVPPALVHPAVGPRADEPTPPAPTPAVKPEAARPTPVEGAPAPPPAKSPARVVAPTKSAQGKSGKRRAPVEEESEEQ